MSEKITYEKLLSNCFSIPTLKSANVAKFRKGPYIAQLSWDREGLPLNQQIIWLLYHPRSMKPIKKVLDNLITTVRSLDGHYMVVIDDYDPSTHYLYTVLMLTDGAFTCNGVSLKMNEDGSNGHIGWIIGQGRNIDPDDDAVIGTLHTIISNIFNAKALQNDPFIQSGRKKLENMKAVFDQTGFRYEELTPQDLNKPPGRP